MGENVYDAIPTLMTPQEILDKALGRAAKVQKEDRDAYHRRRKTTTARVESAATSVTEILERYSTAFPNLERVSTYERELIDVVLGVAALQRNLGRLHGAAGSVRRITKQSLRAMRECKTRDDFAGAYTRFVGRLSSVVDELEPAFSALAHARDVLRRIPEATPGDPTIVFAGYPNVGKSTLLAALSRARPEIAPYPFTTKHVNIGHFHWPAEGQRGARRFQLVDTPGLLERVPEERNEIERQAAVAIAFLADVILFVYDPTETCGYSRAQQQGLREQVSKEFAGVPVLEVYTKGDMESPGPAGALRASGTTGLGVEALRKAIVEALPDDPYAKLLDAES